MFQMVDFEYKKKKFHTFSINFLSSFRFLSYNTSTTSLLFAIIQI